MMSNEDIKMSDVFDGQITVYDECMLKANGYKVASVSRGHAQIIANAINNRDPMALRIKELEAALTKIKDITGELGGQNPANFCEELAMEQDDATYRVYKLSNGALSKALEKAK